MKQYSSKIFKHISLIVTLFLLTVSCSSDDDSSGTIVNTQEKQLAVVVQKFYDSSIENFNGQITTNYEDNKIVSQFGFSETFDPTFARTYQYNSEGLISIEKSIFQPSLISTDLSETESRFEYDEMGRVVSTTNKQGSNETTKTFTYQSDTLILAMGDFSGETSYILNSDGLIEKELSNLGTTTVVYDGNNLTSIIREDQDSTTSLFYEEPVAPRWNYGALLFGANKANSVLLRGYFFAVPSDKYVTKIERKSSTGTTITENKYEFDKEGYLIEQRVTRNENLVEIKTFIYDR